MDDVTKLLDGSIDDVKAGIAGLSHDDLLKLKAAEDAGKTRKGVLDLLDGAIGAAEAKRAGGFTQNAATSQTVAATHSSVAADFDGSGPANIPAADTFDTSGAPQQIVSDVDPSHPAVDNDPRAGTTANMNRIDFNDPNRPGREVVEEQLKASSNA